MWFQLQLKSNTKLTGMVTPLGEFVWRLSDIGRLLNKSNPHAWGVKFRGLTPRHLLPEIFHPCFTQMVLRTHILKSHELEMIVKMKSTELSHYLSWCFKEGRVQVEKGYFNNFNVRQCILAKVHPQGSVRVQEFLEQVKQKACAFYREYERQKREEAQERREPAAGMEGLLNVKEEPLVDGSFLLEESQFSSVYEDSQVGSSSEVPESGPLSGEKPQAGPSREEPQTGSVKDEPGERVESTLIKEESQAGPLKGSGEHPWIVCQGETRITTIYLPEDRYKLEIYLRAERLRLEDQELMEINKVM